jgi:hypothetical protein
MSHKMTYLKYASIIIGSEMKIMQTNIARNRFLCNLCLNY